jgi:hypothetical protein
VSFPRRGPCPLLVVEPAAVSEITPSNVSRPAFLASRTAKRTPVVSRP